MSCKIIQLTEGCTDMMLRRESSVRSSAFLRIFFFEFGVIVQIIEPKPALRGEEMNGPHKTIQLTGGYGHEA